MVVGFYFLVFVLSVIMLIMFIVNNKYVNSLYLLFSIIFAIGNLGRFILATSSGLETAIFANKLVYLGGCFMPFIVFLVVAELSDFKLPRIERIILLMCSTVMMAFAMTVGYTKVFYESVQLKYHFGFYYLDKVYGPAHALYVAHIIMYAILLTLLLIYSYRRSKTVSHKTVASICMFGIAVFATYLIGAAIQLSFDLVSVAYLFLSFFMLSFFERIDMYDMSSSIISTVDRIQEYAYIVFDLRNRYVNANAYAKLLFPELNDVRVDEYIRQGDSYFHKEVVDWFYNSIHSHKDDLESVTKTILINEKYLECSIRELRGGRDSKRGYLVEFVDRTNEQKYISMMQEYSQHLETDVKIKTKRISEMQDSIVLGLATMVESRDNSTGGHIMRTSGVIRIFAAKLMTRTEQFQFRRNFLDYVVKAAPMHDLGKIAIEDSILRKEGRFTDEEYEVMKTHATEGAKIVEHILRDVEEKDFVDIARNVAHYHHEKWDGSGYPVGLYGDNIPIEARIMALADVLDVLVSERCYKKAFSFDKAFEIIGNSLGTQFDPDLGEVFMTCRDELEEMYRKAKEEQA